MTVPSTPRGEADVLEAIRTGRPLSAARVLDRVAAERPDAEAVVARSGRLTYHELDRQAVRHLRALAALGVRPGDRVAVSLVNDLTLVCLFHATMRLGAMWVGVNRALAPPEKRYLVDDSGSAVFIGEADTVEQVRAAGAGLRCVVADPGPGSEWSGLLDADEVEPADPDPLAPAAIAYTSGTTGFPKGAVHSQHNLVVPGAMLAASRRFGPELRKADCFPLTILNLQVLSTLLVPQCGGTAIVMDRVDPEGIAGWLAAERATLWNGAPAMLYSLAADDRVSPGSLATLEEVWSGGGRCSPATAQRFRAKFGREVLSTYGSTEVPTVVTVPPRGAPTDVSANGPPLPHLAVHVLGEDGAECPPSTVGEICVGPTEDPTLCSVYRPMLGYWRNPDATRRALRGGLLHTGDVGYLDERGNLVVEDRQQSLIVRGGANVYPAEIARVIEDFPGVAGTCALGVPDERLGSRVVAVIELDEGVDPEAFDTETLRAHCLSNLARYKVPERFFVGHLPRNAMGKVVAAEVARALGPVDLGDARTGGPS